MSTSDDDIQVRPGRIRHGNRGAKRPQTFVGEVMRAAKKAGHVGSSFRSSQGRSRSRFGRGRRAAVSIRLRSNARRVVMKARVVRHQGTRFRSAPLPKHIAYLKRDGVTRDGADARMFDATSDAADEQAFAERTADDRHHFRFIISPEDAAELADLRSLHPRADAGCRTRSRHQARLGGGRSLEHRQPARPRPDPRPGRRWPGPGHQPRLYQPRLPRSGRRARHRRTRSPQRTRNPHRPGKGGRGRALDQPRPRAARYRGRWWRRRRLAARRRATIRRCAA